MDYLKHKRNWHLFREIPFLSLQPENLFYKFQKLLFDLAFLNLPLHILILDFINLHWSMPSYHYLIKKFKTFMKEHLRFVLRRKSIFLNCFFRGSALTKENLIKFVMNRFNLLIKRYFYRIRFM